MERRVCKKIREVLGRKPHDDPSCKLTTNDINSYCIQAGIVQHKYEFESEIHNLISKPL